MELEIQNDAGFGIGAKTATARQDSQVYRGEEAIRFLTRRTALWESRESDSRQHKDRNHPKALHADDSGLLTCKVPFATAMAESLPACIDLKTT